MVSRQLDKQRHLERLIQKCDLVFLQETHSTTGALSTWTHPAGTRYFSSHGTAAWAGVGILIRTSFLDQFHPLPSDEVLTPSHWEEIEKGRVACLHLDGPNGALDLMVCYLATGNARRQRDDSRVAIAHALQKPSTTLTVLAGDFNYITQDSDAFMGETCETRPSTR